MRARQSGTGKLSRTVYRCRLAFLPVRHLQGGDGGPQREAAKLYAIFVGDRVARDFWRRHDDTVPLV